MRSDTTSQRIFCSICQIMAMLDSVVILVTLEVEIMLADSEEESTSEAAILAEGRFKSILARISISTSGSIQINPSHISNNHTNNSNTNSSLTSSNNISLNSFNSSLINSNNTILNNTSSNNSNSLPTNSNSLTSNQTISNNNLINSLITNSKISSRHTNNQPTNQVSNNNSHSKIIPNHHIVVDQLVALPLPQRLLITT
mmetsp:Transcript_12432/g.14299  ORF Transcript_12432/g.14299 Transcript_12432/m.14299 type:complete len:200 (-) Transcript_12432:217-816(-)